MSITAINCAFLIKYCLTYPKLSFPKIPSGKTIPNLPPGFKSSRHLSINNISLGINTFLGVKRRFEFHIRSKNQIFIEDYAHHPSEINALIMSLRKMYKSKKITMIFQPHLYSRTKDFLYDFASSLSKVDSLILLDIYPARELPIKNFNIDNLYNLINIDEKIFISKDNLVSYISKTKPKFLVSVGAGDVSIYSKKIKEVLV